MSIKEKQFKIILNSSVIPWPQSQTIKGRRKFYEKQIQSQMEI